MEHFFKGYPGFSVLLPKIGCVAAHPANVQRLLYDEEQLVLVFPEGRKGSEKLYKDRYGRAARPRRLCRGSHARPSADRAGLVGRRGGGPGARAGRALKRLTGLLYFLDHAHLPAPRLLGMLGYLPAKPKLRFLEPMRFDEEGLSADKALVQTVAHDIRAHPGEPLGHARQAQVRVVRLVDPRRILVTGVSTYWGGRLTRALEAFPRSRR